MGKNAYFQVVNEDSKMWLQVHLPEPGGKMVTTDDISMYLDKISFPQYEIVDIDNYLKDMNFSKKLCLYDGEIIPESEKCIVTIVNNGERALARFYPPTTGGNSLTEEDIVSDLKLAGIRHGIRKKAIDYFLAKHEYGRDYIIAEATPPVHGHDASIEYFFDINVTAKPKLNEDGSVDFHNLGNIKAVKVGEKLATLTPADKGKPGISVLGETLPARKVQNKMLRFGRNIRLSENKCHIYSEVAGHVTLVDDMVMVSDIYNVPANVDASTGDIDYNGTVEVAGNVNTGYKIKAEGDIIVNGVVEGAELISGGNIVLKRGMQGMERGVLNAKGNITVKFLENCTVKCGGTLMADAILHSNVECKEDIEVLGRKGLVNGGSVETYGNIHVTTLGSTMGTSTKVEIISDKDLILKTNDLKEKIEESEENIKKIDKMAEVFKKQIQSGGVLLPEQKQHLKQATLSKPILVRELKKMRRERESILADIERHKNSHIRVERDVYPGVKIVVKDVMKIQHEPISHCKFVRDGADVRAKGLY